MKSNLDGLAAREVFIMSMNEKSKKKSKSKSTKSTKSKDTFYKYTTVRANQICDQIAKGLPILQSAIACGISRTTFYRWKDERPEFEEMVNQAVAVSEARLLNKISDAEDWRAAAWVMERRFPDRWAKRDKVEMNLNRSEGLKEIVMMFEQTNDLVESVDKPGHDDPKGEA